MKQELQEKLFKKYPKLFQQKDLSMQETCMCWGISCGDGWFVLLDTVCSAIQSYVLYNKVEEVQFTQVKEKWGGLRIYTYGGDPYVDGLISMAEAMSYRICEECGSSKGELRKEGWFKTLCHSCTQTNPSEPASS